MRDNEKRGLSISMDDLMVKTISMIDTLPERIQKVESYVRELEMKFAAHEGEQKQGIRRISDKVTSIEQLCRELHSETIKQLDFIKKDIDLLDNIEGLTEEQKTILSNLKTSVDLLNVDLVSRQKVKSTLWYYSGVVAQNFIRYAMLPITLVFFLFIGINPDFLPWIKSKPSTTSIGEYNVYVMKLMNNVHQDQINESALQYWQNTTPKDLIYVSTSSDISQALYENEKLKYDHVFIWLPIKKQEGYIQVYNSLGNKIGSSITIMRGK